MLTSPTTLPPTLGGPHRCRVPPRVIEVESLKAGWRKRKGLHRRFVNEFGDRRLTAITPNDIDVYARKARRSAAAKHEALREKQIAEGTYSSARTTDGTGAQRSVIEAARAFIAVAINDGLMGDNPAKALKLPKRKPAQPRAASDAELGELWQTVISVVGVP